jgi:hypothetical protein
MHLHMPCVSVVSSQSPPPPPLSISSQHQRDSDAQISHLQASLTACIQMQAAPTNIQTSTSPLKTQNLHSIFSPHRSTPSSCCRRKPCRSSCRRCRQPQSLPSPTSCTNSCRCCIQPQARNHSTRLLVMQQQATVAAHARKVDAEVWRPVQLCFKYRKLVGNFC